MENREQLSPRSTENGRPTRDQRGTNRRGGTQVSESSRPSGQAVRQRIGSGRSVWAYHSEIKADWIPGNGWNIVLPHAFTTLNELIELLSESRLENRIRHLGIAAHGGRTQGTVGTTPALTSQSVRSNQVQLFLRQLQEYLVNRGELTFFSCTAGAGIAGTNLLTQLSTKLPNRTVTGFITFGLHGGGRLVAGNITDSLITSYPGRELEHYPRVTLNRPSAKKAKNGVIIAWPQYRALWDDLVRVDPDFADQITDRWLEERGRERYWFSDADPEIRRRNRRDYQLQHWQRTLPPGRVIVPGTRANSPFEYYVQRHLDYSL